MGLFLKKQTNKKHCNLSHWVTNTRSEGWLSTWRGPRFRSQHPHGGLKLARTDSRASDNLI